MRQWMAAGWVLACGLSSLGMTDEDVLLRLDPKALAGNWEVVESTPKGLEPRLTQDEILGGPVLAVEAKERLTLRSRQTVAGLYRVEALFRLPGQAGRGTIAGLQCGPEQAGGIPAWRLEVARNSKDERGFSAIAASASDEARKPVSLPFQPRFPAADISPILPEALRLELENDALKIPPAADRWHLLRIDALADRVRLMHDGALVRDCEKTAATDGPIRVVLSGPARLAALVARRLIPQQGPFHSLSLQKLCNARGDLDLSGLGEPGAPVVIRGVPMVLPHPLGRGDHVDVGESRFQHRMGKGYGDFDGRDTWPRLNLLDPARLVTSVPRRAYRRAWVLAGFDGTPHAAPVLTLRFFKPQAGWAIDAEVQVPSTSSAAVPVKTRGGGNANLWLVPVPLDSAALAGDFREEGLFHIELTKKVLDHRAFPDPCNYDAFQGGLKSGVRVYGLTLEEAPLWAHASGTKNGNLYPHPEKPAWIAHLQSQRPEAVTADVRIEVTSPHGGVEKLARTVEVAPGASLKVPFEPAAREYGLYRVKTVISAGDWSQSRDGSFLALPPDTRRATPENSPWGVWCWYGAHGTNPDVEENFRLMKTLGMRLSARLEEKGRGKEAASASLYKERQEWGLGPEHVRIISRNLPDWAAKIAATPAPAEIEAFRESIGRAVKEAKERHPDLVYVNCFAENSVSLRMTHGMPPYAFGEPWFTDTDKERERIRAFYEVARAGYEGAKKHAPEVKFIMGHCAACFWLPFFREKDWDGRLFDGFGLDLPQFERMPERQPRSTEPSLLYFLRREMRERGMADKELVHLESYFPSSHRLALGHRGQADSVVRTAVLSLALGTTRFLQSWSLHDCSDRWGTQHYGCVGLIGRRPEYNPKPAAAAYATMTRVLDLAKYDGWLPTGSRSAFCVRFKDETRGRRVYCAWTVRGSRPLKLETEPGTALATVDENGNEKPAGDAVTLSPTPLWLVAAGGALRSVQVGAPAYAEAPGPHRIMLEDFEARDWTCQPGDYPRFSKNHWDMARKPGKMEARRVDSAERRSRAFQVTLAEVPPGMPCVDFFGVYTPPAPIPIPGKAEALGLYVNGRSAWNRVIYEIVDARGESWISAGTKDAWNCDDIHSWSSVNFDGWRYMEFPLPGNAPGDDYREKDAVWWGSDREGILDLPVKLARIIVQMRPQMVYVDEMLPVDSLTIEIDDLQAVYRDAESMEEGPVRLQQEARVRFKPARDGGAPLPNPIEKLAASGAGAAPEIARVYPPEARESGDQVYVEVKPVEGAQSYQVYVSAYADGRGAKALGKSSGAGNVIYIRGLQPSIPMYLFATYIDRDKKESKPSKGREVRLEDEFPFK